MTAPEQPLDLDALEAVAKAATPGPWKEVYEDDDAFCSVVRIRGDAGLHVITVSMGCDPPPEPSGDDCEFFKTFNPLTVLALIERVRRAEGQPSESYPLGWLEAVVHWNPESGAIHTDGNREALRALIAKAEEAP